MLKLSLHAVRRFAAETAETAEAEMSGDGIEGGDGGDGGDGGEAICKERVERWLTYRVYFRRRKARMSGVWPAEETLGTCGEQ